MADTTHEPSPPSFTATTAAPLSPNALAAAAAGLAEEAARGPGLVDEAKSFAEAARVFAEAEEPRAPRLAEDLMERASALAVAADLLLQEWISTPTSATKLAVKALRLSLDSQVLVPGFALFAAPPPDEEGWTELQSLLRRARQFSSDASGTLFSTDIALLRADYIIIA
jgi:hypothetical protein